MLKMTDEEKLIQKIQLEIFDYIKNNDIYYIADLWYYAEHERQEDWFPVLRKRNFYRAMKIYFESLRRVMRREKKKVPPPKHSIHDENIIRTDEQP